MFHGMIFTFLTMALFKPPPKKNQSLANFTAISKTYQFAVKKVHTRTVILHMYFGKMKYNGGS